MKMNSNYSTISRFLGMIVLGLVVSSYNPLQGMEDRDNNNSNITSSGSAPYNSHYPSSPNITSPSGPPSAIIQSTSLWADLAHFIQTQGTGLAIGTWFGGLGCFLTWGLMCKNSSVSPSPTALNIAVDPPGWISRIARAHPIAQGIGAAAFTIMALGIPYKIWSYYDDQKNQGNNPEQFNLLQIIGCWALKVGLKKK